MLFVIDETTDEPFLRATFAKCWAGVPARSPNLRTPSPRVRLFRLTGRRAGSVPARVREVTAGAGGAVAAA